MGTNIPVKLSQLEILFGYWNPNNFFPLNTIFIGDKKLHFLKVTEDIALDNNEVKHHVKHLYDYQEFVVLLDLKQEKFNNIWMILKNIFRS